jgi:dolichol-phosphate mannosyltransferase
MDAKPLYSLVVPVYNEAANLPALIDEITAVMDDLGQAWELLVVDDGSTDQTQALFAARAQHDKHIVSLRLERNRGQSAALAAGFTQARGNIVITLDGDRQNDPTDIPQMIAALQQCDLVCGRRMRRQDNWWRLIFSAVANTVRKRICDDGIHDAGCALKAFRRDCLPHIKLFDGMHRFLPALFRLEGYRVREIPVRHRPRTAGRSKYPWYRRLLKPLIDLCAVAWMRKRHLGYRVESP